MGEKPPRCGLRGIDIEMPAWTVCPHLMGGSRDDTPPRYGPVYARVVWHNGYEDLPYCEGQRPHGGHRDGVWFVQWTGSDGAFHEFGDLDEYRSFRHRRERENAARGLMVGAGLGNVLGVPFEFRNAPGAEDVLRDSVWIIDDCPYDDPCDDDDLAQTVLVAEGCLSGPQMSALPEALWAWGELNGVGMGGLTRGVLKEWSGMQPMRRAGKAGEARSVSTDRTMWEASLACAERLAGSGRDAGNGALMRASPVAVRWAHCPEELVQATIAQCTATHAAPACVWSCLVYVERCARPIRGHLHWQPVTETLERCEEMMASYLDDGARAQPWHERYRHCPESVRKACEDAAGRQDFMAIAQGHGWGWTVTSLTMALEAERRWAMYEVNDPASLLACVIEGDGDTDTHGCIAGALIGAHAGAAAWPRAWTEALKARRQRMNTQERIRNQPRTSLEEWAGLLLQAAAQD